MAVESGDGVPESRSPLPSMEFGQIDAPGAYVLHRTGLLLRVPPDAVEVGRSPVITLTGTSGVWVSRLSDDPWIPVNRARSIAANHDLLVNF